MQATRPAGDDRLPWLEPYREEPRRRRPPKRTGSRGPLYAGALALLIGAAGTGYWIGQRETALAEPRTRGSDIVPLPPPRQPAVETAPPVAPVAPVTIETTAPPKIEPERADKPAAAPVKKKAAAPAKRPRRKIRAGVESSRLGQVRRQQERGVAVRPWPKMPSPGPAGQVIQLGAFSTAARANAAYQSRIARYPALQSMPKVVVPIITGPRRKVLYVLRLGTSSRQHSHVVCRNLRASGDHCIVIG